MSIIIDNISPDDAPQEGVNDYLVRINSKGICTFQHDRKVDGLAQCLRDAANALDAMEEPLYVSESKEILTNEDSMSGLLNLFENLSEKSK